MVSLSADLKIQLTFTVSYVFSAIKSWPGSAVDTAIQEDSKR